MSSGSASIQRLSVLRARSSGRSVRAARVSSRSRAGRASGSSWLERLPAQVEGVERPVLHPADLQQEQPGLGFPRRGRDRLPQRPLRLGRPPQRQAGPALAQMGQPRGPGGGVDPPPELQRRPPVTGLGRGLGPRPELHPVAGTERPRHRQQPQDPDRQPTPSPRPAARAAAATAARRADDRLDGRFERTAGMRGDVPCDDRLPSRGSGSTLPTQSDPKVRSILPDNTVSENPEPAPSGQDDSLSVIARWHAPDVCHRAGLPLPRSAARRSPGDCSPGRDFPTAGSSTWNVIWSSGTPSLRRQRAATRFARSLRQESSSLS